MDHQVTWLDWVAAASVPVGGVIVAMMAVSQALHVIAKSKAISEIRRAPRDPDEH
jgi:hypothetical protein